jgi:hypothetical protein
MLDDDTVYLKVTISRDVSRRLKVFVSNRYPDLLRGPLSKEVEKALVRYLDSKERKNEKYSKKEVLQHTHAHTETKQHQHQHQQSNNDKKYQRLIDTIKEYSKSQRQIPSGLAKKAIQQTIGKDDRTVDKYLKILQDDDILYGDSSGGSYHVQSWVFNDYNLVKQVVQQEQECSGGPK